MSREKLRTHIDLYLRSLSSFPESSGRVMLLDLVKVLVFRFPTPVLVDEALVFFIPLVGAATRDENTDVKARACAALITLMSNVGLHVVAPTILEWAKQQTQRVRVTALQLFPLFAAAAVCVVQNLVLDASDVLTRLDRGVPLLPRGATTARAEDSDLVWRSVSWMQPILHSCFAPHMENTATARGKKAAAVAEKLFADGAGGPRTRGVDLGVPRAAYRRGPRHLRRDPVPALCARRRGRGDPVAVLP